jgi:multicomponent Na+:H+ antiporter subunit E
MDTKKSLKRLVSHEGDPFFYLFASLIFQASTSPHPQISESPLCTALSSSCCYSAYGSYFLVNLMHFTSAISSSFFFSNRSKTLSTRIGELMRLPGYMLWLLWQVVLSNIHILKMALTPGEIKELDPSLVRIKTKLKTDFGKYALANSITLTPGTITIDIDGDEMLIHSISKHTADGVKDDTMERKVAQVFEGGSK